MRNSVKTDTDKKNRGADGWLRSGMRTAIYKMSVGYNWISTIGTARENLSGEAVLARYLV